MDWAIVIFLVVAGTTAGSLSWWCASEVAKAGRDDSPREGTTASPTITHGGTRDPSEVWSRGGPASPTG